jgi:prephenate dehydratase
MTRVAFQGELGAFSWEALRGKFGPGVEPYPCKTFQDLFNAVTNGEAELGLAPVENSQAGSVNDVFDLLRQHNLTLTGEVLHPVNLCLMALPGQTIGSIGRVISHPVALAQCDQHLRQLGVEIMATYDTAGSAKLIREEGLIGVAAVAGAGAAELYGLEILAHNIQTVAENVTRFVVLNRDLVERQPGPQRTMMVMVVTHEPGSLYAALGTLAARSINLLKIESRPSKNTPWEYVFYLEFEGHRDDPAVRDALAEVGAYTSYVKVLGSFRRADPASTKA